MEKNNEFEAEQKKNDLYTVKKRSRASVSLQTIAEELKGIRTILGAMWHSRYKNEETDVASPEIYADEYISVEECAKRLGLTDQTIRNWILQGKKDPFDGWVQGVHYIIIPKGKTKSLIRIPWNNLILSFYKGPEVTLRSFDPVMGRPTYTQDKKDKYSPQPNPHVAMPNDVDKPFSS